MKTTSSWNFRYIVGKALMGLVLAAMIGSVDVATSFADDHNDRGRRPDNGRYENRGRGHDRDRYVRGRRVYRSYGYRERVYVPPPVILAPPPPPGIGIFFPPVIFRP